MTNLNGFTFKAGGNIEMDFVQKFTDQTMTSVAKDDPWFQAFSRATDKHNVAFV